MANMSYCRFENTNRDFVDCLCAIKDCGLEDLSETERMYAKRLYENAKEFIEEYEYAVENYEEETEED